MHPACKMIAFIDRLYHPHLCAASPKTPKKILLSQKKNLFVWVKLNQHCVKQEAPGVEMRFSFSLVLPYARRSCLSWQPELFKELCQEQGTGAVSPFLLPWSPDMLLIPSREQNFCRSGRSASSTSQAGDHQVCSMARRAPWPPQGCRAVQVLRLPCTFPVVGFTMKAGSSEAKQSHEYPAPQEQTLHLQFYYPFFF